MRESLIKATMQQWCMTPSNYETPLPHFDGKVIRSACLFNTKSENPVCQCSSWKINVWISILLHPDNEWTLDNGDHNTPRNTFLLVIATIKLAFVSKHLSAWFEQTANRCSRCKREQTLPDRWHNSMQMHQLVAWKSQPSLPPGDPISLHGVAANETELCSPQPCPQFQEALADMRKNLEEK